MPVLRPSDAVVHELHGSRFSSYVAPGAGSTELCAWRVEVPPGTFGVAHTVSREEVLLVLGGTVRVNLDGVESRADTGDVVHVPAGSTLQLDNHAAASAVAWVTTSVGFEAVLADGGRITPPWTR